MKGEGYFPFDAEKIIEYIRRADIRHEYDKYTDHAKIITETDHRTILAYAKIKKYMIVSPRDLVFATQLITSKECGVLYCPSYSVELAEYPPNKDAVRAQLPLGGWILMNAPEGGCKAIYASEINFGGSIPKFMLEKSADVQVAILTNLRDYMMKKEGVKPGEVWKRPASEAVPSNPSSPSLGDTSASDTNQDIADKTKSDVISTTLQASSLSSGEESKTASKYFDISVDLKNKTKVGSAKDMGFDASFGDLTEDDFAEAIPEDVKGKEHILLCRKKVFQLFEEINGEFTRLSPSKEVAIFTRDNGEEGTSVLGIGTIPFNIDKIADVLIDEQQRAGFDEMLKEAKILEELPLQTFIMWCRFKKVVVVSSRDFVCCGAFIKFKDGTYAFPTFSIEGDYVAEDPKFVRAHLF